MESNQRKHNSKVEINDLIDDAVNNALARRNEALVDVSNEEAENIAGGLAIFPIILGFIKPFPLGKIACPPIVVGLIAVNPIKTL
jgi:hypothetical protein